VQSAVGLYGNGEAKSGGCIECTLLGCYRRSPRMIDGYRPDEFFPSYHAETDLDFNGG